MDKQKIYYRKTKDLIEYDSNPREHSPKQIQQVADSISEFGWTMPILIDETNEIIAGHGRLLGAKKLKIEEVPCLIAKGWTEEQKKAYCIADNKLTENSNWKDDELRLNLSYLFDEGFDVSLTGFSVDEIEGIIPDFTVNEGIGDDEEVPDTPEEPVAKLGDIWQLGEHRVICGDATDPLVYNQLMDGKRANMVHTDPPYNIDYGNIQHPKFKVRNIDNDNMTSKEYAEFCEQWAENVAVYCDGIVYCWGHQGKAGRVQFTVLDNKFHNSTTIMWYKDVFTLGRGKYQNQFEPCWFGWVKTGESFSKSRKLANVWRIARPKRSDLHPTMKPIELCDTAIKHSSTQGDIVMDIFLGSGSTLISCQKLNRICYGIELDPKYVDVIIKRWEKYSGLEAIHSETGKTYQELYAEPVTKEKV